MRGFAWFVAPVVAVALVVAIAFGAYQAGRHHAVDHGRVVQIEQPAVTSTGQPVTVVVERGYGHWRSGWGFFPGFFFLPLLFVLLFFLFFRGGWGGRRAYWRGRGFDAEEWHRRQHEGPSPGGPAAAGS